MTGTTLGYAFLGGLLPSFIWLYFLLKEDASHPEPKHIIALAFIAGMVGVYFALPLEQWSCASLAIDPLTPCTTQLNNYNVIVSWALIEEVIKYIMAATFILWRRAVDESPDYVIYMITVALGFAAAENTLFLIAPLEKGQFLMGVITGNLRFLGSTLLHVVASAAIGLTFAFSANLRPPIRTAAAALGLILAIALHVAFNTFIIKQDGSSMLSALFLVWSGVVVIFAAFEVLKFFQYRNFPNKT